MYNKIHRLALAISLGFVWGLGMLIIGLLGTLFDFGSSFVQLFGEVYVGFAPTLIGSIIGACYGFCDAFIGGFILATIYNFVLNKFTPTKSNR